MGWLGWCAVGRGRCDACWSAGFRGVLEDGDEEFDEEGGGEGGDARTGDGALLVKGGVAERLCSVLVWRGKGKGGGLHLRERRHHCRSSSRVLLRRLG
jgi:hypothetical protein